MAGSAGGQATRSGGSGAPNRVIPVASSKLSMKSL